MARMAIKNQGNAVFPDRAAQRELKLEALYEHAASAFNEKGFHGTSLDDIAAALGVSKPALYRYVPNKQALLYRLHCISLDAAEAAVTEGEASPTDGVERLRIALYLYIRSLTASSSACLVLMEEGAMTGAAAAEILSRRRAFEGRFRTLVSAGIRDGSVAPCDPKFAVFSILGAGNWVSRWYRPGGTRSGEDVARIMSRQLVRGLAADPSRYHLDGDVRHAS
ncbi:TetR family transcriptional regulator [Candidatus Terasakiella magnetica]|nr:TetR family transcriptional regulator [Candidatus Terasakiella magnetica]